MGYAIVGGVGLLVGIGLLIWALRERSARHEAERAADSVKAVAADLRQALDANQAALGVECKLHEATRQGAEALRETLERLRVQLRTSQDPATIKAWLDAELKGLDL